MKSPASLLLALVLLAACRPFPATGTPVPIAVDEVPLSPTPFQPGELPTSASPFSPLAILPSQTPETVPTIPVSLIFAVIGDYGKDNQPEADVAALVNSWAPDLIITTGDNNYDYGFAATIDANIGRHYGEYIFPYLGEYGPGADVNRFFPSPGNHEWDTRDMQPYLDYFTLPGNERYYNFVWGPVHFFALDSDTQEPDGIGLSSVQAAWLRERLAASTSPWQIVYMHHPPYSSGGGHGSTDYMQWPFAEWGADAVLAGHDHTYERLAVEGIPYFVNGLGGAPRYDFEAPLAESRFRYNVDYGAMRVTASATEILFEFFTRAGERIDWFSLNR